MPLRSAAHAPTAPSRELDPIADAADLAGDLDRNPDPGGKVYLRLPEVLRRYGCSRASVYAWIGAGHFPAPTRLGPRLVAWPSDELLRWEATRPH